MKKDSPVPFPGMLVSCVVWIPGPAESQGFFGEMLKMTQGGISEERAAFLAEDFARGFIKYCGFEAEKVERGRFQSRVSIGEEHRQQDGFIHAGVMAAMADHTAGYSAFTTVADEYQILTIEFKINFLRPAYGDALICRARVIRGGSKIIISESEVWDVHADRENLAAKAMVTLMAVHRDRLQLKR